VPGFHDGPSLATSAGIVFIGKAVAAPNVRAAWFGGRPGENVDHGSLTLLGKFMKVSNGPG
jgi:hypothetical protein